MLLRPFSSINVSRDKQRKEKNRLDKYKKDKKYPQLHFVFFGLFLSEVRNVQKNSKRTEQHLGEELYYLFTNVKSKTPRPLYQNWFPDKIDSNQ